MIFAMILALWLALGMNYGFQFYRNSLPMQLKVAFILKKIVDIIYSSLTTMSVDNRKMLCLNLQHITCTSSVYKYKMF
jgi:hypothetical protein